MSLVGGHAFATPPLGLSYATPPPASFLEQSLPAPIASDVPLQDFASAFGTRSFAVGDVNGDGLIDVVGVPGYGRWLPMMPMQIWINQGGGVFADRTTDLIEGTNPVINSAQVFLIADFNGDGRADIIIIESGLEDTIPPRGGKLIVFLSQPNGKLVDKTSEAVAGNTAFHYQSGVAADVNGDGALDIVLSRPCQQEFEGCGVVILLNDGTGHFTPSFAGLPHEIAYFTFPPPPAPFCCPSTPFQNPNAVGAGDIDGDGRVDIITGSGNGGDDFNNTAQVRTIRIHQQQPDGSFVERVRSPIPDAIKDVGYLSANRFADDPPAGMSVNQIVVADLNGDGRPDIIVLWEGSTSHIEILRNDGNFEFTDVTVDWFGSYVAGGGLHNVGIVEVADVDGDGHLDLVFRTPLGAHPPSDLVTRSFIFLNDGTGRFSPWTLRFNGVVPSADTVAGLLACAGCNLSHMPMAFDANGDGIPDVVLITRRDTVATPVREQTVVFHTFLASHADLADRQLTTTKTGSGTGTVTSLPNGIICGSTCAATYAQGATITLSAKPAADSVFDGWTGCDTMMGVTCAVSLTSNRAVSVRFVTRNNTLTVSLGGSGTGMVTASIGTIACPATCSAQYARTSTVMLTAVGDAGSTFRGWSGACDGAVPTCTMTLDAPWTVIATFSTTFTDGDGLAASLSAGTIIKAVHVTELRAAIEVLRFRHQFGAPLWTDTSLGPGTVVKAVHFLELGSALTEAYQAAQRTLPTLSPVAQGAVIRATHLNELRAAVRALE